MNTFAKIGKVALAHLFSKIQIFELNWGEIEGRVKILPRQVIKSNTEIDLQKPYLQSEIDDSGKHTMRLIFSWGIEIGLSEALVQSRSIVLEDYLPFQYYGMHEDLVSHVVIAEKIEWEDDSQSFSQEIVTIYALTQDQQIQLVQSSEEEGEDPTWEETPEDFTLNHLEFPCNFSDNNADD